MRLVLLYYICKVCGTKFTSPSVYGYGEFLMRSESGDLAYLYAIDDPVFKNFSKQLAATPELANKQQAKTKALHNTFGFACDLSIDGTFYQITNKPKCPKCNNINYADFGITNPPESVDLDLSPVTHNLWQSLSKEKQELIVSLIVKHEIEKVIVLLNQWREQNKINKTS
jgi:hypothetical protein